MQKRSLSTLLILCLVSCTYCQTNVRLFDQPMKVKQANIQIQSNTFTVTTAIELEFYNPNGKEIEGLYAFELRPGQVITAFQLELNGKYRDGSIEEKWKARSAYNNIVGKRIDPALLMMDYRNHYSLRIYPVPPGGSRKVTLTIQQLLKDEGNQLEYSLPLYFADTVGVLSLDIAVHSGNQSPKTLAGLIREQNFTRNNGHYELKWIAQNLPVKTPIAFSLSINGGQTSCTKSSGNRQYFAARVTPTISAEYEIHPKTLTVFWDASSSGLERDIKKEISFLRQFISFHRIEELKIIPFTSKLLDTVRFDSPYKTVSKWRNYLEQLDYDGATQLGAIQVNDAPDVVMIFSDGKNSYGSKTPKTNNRLTYWVQAASGFNPKSLSSLVGISGGKAINLNQLTTSEAILQNNKAENWLVNITSASGKTIIDDALPMKVTNHILINGSLGGNTDTLFLHFGNAQGINSIQKLIVGNNGECDGPIDRISMMKFFEEKLDRSFWENLLEFGLKEKIVTYYTSYIVLERVEDYIKYNISPPKDLEEECERMNFVKRDTRETRRMIQVMDGLSTFNKVIEQYNTRLSTWNARSQLISPFIRGENITMNSRSEGTTSSGSSTNPSLPGTSLVGNVPGLQITQSLDEVVVMGYGTVRRNSITGSVSVVRANQLFPSSTVEQALAGRVAGVEVQENNSAIFGSTASIRIRGASSLNGKSEPLWILDGMPVSGHINDLVNVNDIDNITVIKGAQAAALYGSAAANGVIVINTKRGRWNYYRNYSSKPYRLKDLEDVDYIEDIKATPNNEKLMRYEQLRKSNGNKAGFYIDMSEHFYQMGMHNEALKVLMNAAEVSNGDWDVLKAMGFVMEKWGDYEHAIEIYQHLLEDVPTNVFAYRDLALAYYESGEYQKSIDLLYQGIRLNADSTYAPLKASMLSELNAIIAVHKDKLNLSGIPSTLIAPMPVDLRIFVDANTENMGRIEIREPGGHLTTSDKKLSKNGGVLYSGVKWYSEDFADYSMKELKSGTFKIRLHYSDYYSYRGSNLAMIRIMIFRNFGKQNQTIQIENVIMDNQNGEVEIADYRF